MPVNRKGKERYCCAGGGLGGGQCGNAEPERWREREGQRFSGARGGETDDERGRVRGRDLEKQKMGRREAESRRERQRQRDGDTQQRQR